MCHHAKFSQAQFSCFGSRLLAPASRTLSCLVSFPMTFASHPLVLEPSASISLHLSGDQRRLPGLSRSTSPSAPSLHARSGSTSIFRGLRGREGHSDFTHARRRSDFVPVRALLLFSDWSIGHEVGSRSPRDAILPTPNDGLTMVFTPNDGVTIVFCIHARLLPHGEWKTFRIILKKRRALFSIDSVKTTARCPR